MNINAPQYLTESLDTGTLSWVKDEIGKSLLQAQQALEYFAGQPEDKTQLRFCITYLHQVFGTLQMVEIFGAALLAEEMEKTTSALLSGETDHFEESLDALMRGIIQLPAYLENLQRGHPDIPAVLTPLINDLRNSRGAPLLTDTAFFYPDLEATPTPPALPDAKPALDIQAYARKLRPVFQSALLAWLRDNHDKNSLKRLAAVIRELQKSSATDAARRAWWIMGGLIEALNDNGLDPSKPLNLLLSHMDAEIKRLIHHGETAFSEEPPRGILKTCLYHIGRARSHGPLVSTLQSAFKLDQLIPLGATVDQAIDALKGSSVDIMRTVSGIIKSDLLEVNEILDVFGRNPQAGSGKLLALVGILKRTANTLEMLGRQDLRKLISNQADTLQDFINTAPRSDKDLSSDNTLMEIASALIYVEKSLDKLELFSDAIGQQTVPNFSLGAEFNDVDQNLMPESELHQIKQHVFEQSLDELSFIKTGLNRYADETDGLESIQDIPEKLLQIKGTLNFMGLERPARLVTAINAFIENLLQAPSTSPTLEQLDTLADAITSIEFFFEALAEGRDRPEAVLTVADISMEQLGYPANGKSVIAAFPGIAKAALAAPSENPPDKSGSQDEPGAEHSIHTANGPLQNEFVDQEILDVFVTEATDIIARIKTSFVAWQLDQTDQESLTILRRGYHTLKGSGRLAGAMVLSEFAWALENILNKIINGKLKASTEVFDLLQQAQPLLDDLLAVLKGTSSSYPSIQTLYHKAKALAATLQPVGLDNIARTNRDDQQGPITINPEAQQDLSAFDPALADVFSLETHTHLAAIYEFLKHAGQSESAPITKELYLALHTLDSSARMASVELITRLSRPMNTLVRELYENLQPFTASGLTTLKSFADTIDTLVKQFNNPQAIDTEYHQLLSQILALQNHETGDDAAHTDTSVTAQATEALTKTVGIDSKPANAGSTDIGVVDVNVVDKNAADYGPELLAVFLEEAEETQEKIERILHQWTQDSKNLQPVAELQRALHTFKGSARMANVLPIGDLAHAMESLLEGISSRRFNPQSEHLALLQNCHDWLAHALEKAQQLKTVEPAEDLLAQIDDAIERATQSSPEASVDATADAESASENAELQADTEHSHDLNEIIEFIETFTFDAEQEATRKAKPAPVIEDQIRVRAELLNELVNHSGEINIYNARIAQQLNEWQFNLTELQHTVERLHDQMRQFEIEAETQIIYRHEPAAGGEMEDFDPLELDRFSNMQQLSRGMVESLSDLTSIENNLEHLSGDTGELLLQQQRITSELQEGLMRTRMVSFSSILPRLRRVIRQTCNETRKYAELNVRGAEVDLDRTQLSRIVSIIEHILRNAVDHGIEPPQEREQLGKNRIGQLYLDYQHQGSEIVLTIRDDGAGIDIDTLRKHAFDKGLMAEDEQLSDQEIINFIYHSGFSTAETLTQISGRGLGLDVVNAEVNQLGGNLQIKSEAGKGARFTLNFPLSLLINQALMVQVADASYAIQLPHVEHVVRVGREELEALFSGQESNFNYAGHVYPYLNLGHSLYGQASPLPEERDRLPLLLLRSGEQRLAVHVDQLLGNQEIVIKSLGPQLGTVDILSGASILPDGQVALILDVANLIRTALSQKENGVSAPLLAVSQDNQPEPGSLKVLIVDDSITVRKVTARLLTRYHYLPFTAKDGVEAMQLMDENLPDIILVDVEMPRMDGYELASQMRASPQLKHIPIIMITSRSGEKHRQRALEIGVDRYMGKPFQEKELIDHIQTLTLDQQDSNE